MKITDKFFTDKETKDVSIAILVEPKDLEGIDLAKVSHKNKDEKGFEIWASALAVAEYKIGKRKLQFLTSVKDAVEKGYFNLVRTVESVMADALSNKDLDKFAAKGVAIQYKPSFSAKTLASMEE